jgi:hypothetical protein
VCAAVGVVLARPLVLHCPSAWGSAPQLVVQHQLSWGAPSREESTRLLAPRSIVWTGRVRVAAFGVCVGGWAGV